jgi:hypothetical protein
MGLPKGKELEFIYEYDFAVSGGAISSINLINKGNNNMEAGLIITDIAMHIEAAITSGGTPTVTLGNAGNTSGYFADFRADATLNAVLTRGDRAGALVWDDTNDHPINYRIGSTADAAPSLTIGTAALTAGKFKVYLKAFKPLS